MAPDIGATEAPSPATAVVVVHWRQPEWCARSVRSLQAATGASLDLMVVNNSPEDAPRLRDLLGPEVRILEAGRNLGYAGGANLGLRHALGTDATAVVVGSHDLEVRPGALDELAAALDDDPGLAVVGPLLEDKVAGSGSAAQVGGGSAPVDVSWVSGTCMMMRADAVRSLGGFDRSLHSYSEDVDWCWRAAGAGWRIAVVPSARAKGSGTGDVVAMERHWMNIVRVELRHHGAAAAAAAYLRLVKRFGRFVALSLSRTRSPSDRRQLRARATSLAVSCLRVDLLVRRSRTDL